MRRMSKQRRIHVQLSGHERAARGHAKMSGSALLYCGAKAVHARQCAARQSSGKYMCSCPGTSGRRWAMRKRAAPRLYIAAHKRCVPGNAPHVKAAANTCAAVRARAVGAGSCASERLRAFILRCANGVCPATRRMSKQKSEIIYPASYKACILHTHVNDSRMGSKVGRAAAIF